jgi:predicted transcriptional regulator
MLFDLGHPDVPPLARNTDPVESHLAARDIKPKLAAIHRWVLDLVRQHPGLTAAELAQAVGVGDVRKINRRLPELELMGLVRRLAQRACSVSGKLARPWAAEEQ